MDSITSLTRKIVVD